MQVVRATAWIIFATCLSWGFIGCASQQLAPDYASSTDQPSYAKEHPGQLESTRQQLDAQLALAQSLCEEFKGYPGELKDPDWNGVLVVVGDADVEGRSPHFAESLEHNGKVAAFYEDEKEEIHKRVGGSVQYQAKNKGCTADMYSPAVVALDKAMKARLEERAHDHSEAHTYLRLNQDTLGKANTEALTRQADRIALASYVTHVGLVRSKNKLDTLIDDASAVNTTLQNRIDELQRTDPNEKPSKATLAARDEELKELEAAKALLPQQLEGAKQQSESAEQRIVEARRVYDDALSQLKASIEEQAKSAAAKP